MSMGTLGRIRKSFPQVEELRDATSGIVINVTEKDSQTARKKDPEDCALARACMRQNLADGAIIGIGYSWLIKGKVATRYKTTTTVSREITSFDRHHDFAPGKDYMLSRISPGSRMGRQRTPLSLKSGKHNGSARQRTVHHTENIRVIHKYGK